MSDRYTKRDALAAFNRLMQATGHRPATSYKQESVMTEYVVRWEIPFTASTPEEAAYMAQQAMLDSDSLALYFEVFPGDPSDTDPIVVDLSPTFSAAEECICDCAEYRLPGCDCLVCHESEYANR